MDMMQVKKTVSKNVAALLVMGMAVTMGAGMMQTAEAAAFDPNRPAAMQQGEDRRAPQAKEKTPNKKVKKAPKKEAERRKDTLKDKQNDRSKDNKRPNDNASDKRPTLYGRI